MKIQAIMPWRATSRARNRAFHWVIDNIAQTFPRGWKWGLSCPPLDAVWSKGGIVMPPIRNSTADIIIVIDADVWCEGTEAAVQAVADGAPWACPHRQLRRLSEAATEKVLAGADPFEDGMELAEPERGAYVGVAGGGIVVIPRLTALRVPMDPRFTGWGQEDHSWGYALTTLEGKPWRPEDIAPMVHLWHPPAARLNRFWGSAANKDLAARYLAARSDPEAMEKLIGEIDWAPDPNPTDGSEAHIGAQASF